MGGSSNVSIPALHITGWHDVFLGSSLSTFVALHDTTPHQRLIVTPWGHRLNGETVGDSWLGPSFDINLHRVQVEWFAAWLKDAYRTCFKRTLR